MRLPVAPQSRRADPRRDFGTGQAMNKSTPPELVAAADPMPMTAIADAPPAPSRRSRRRLLLLAGAAALVAGGVGFHLLGHKPAVIASADAATTARTLPDGSFRLSAAEVRLLRIEPTEAREFRPESVAEGRISYNEERATPVFPPYSGRVVRALAQPGQQVRAGDVLFEIETTDLTQAANDLLTANDNLAKARNQVELTRRNETRQSNLFAARAAARRDVEQAQADLANALADQRSAEAAVASARDRLRVLGRDAAAIAEIEATRRVNAVIPVTAPLGGTVVQRRVGPGQWLAAGGGDPVYTIADLSQMWLVAAVRELDAPLVRVGQAVEVTVDALPGQRFRARVENVANSLDPATRRLTVRAAIEDPEHLLKPEMFAAFRIAVGEPRSGVAVPIGALIHRGASASLWEALDDNRFIMRNVRTGLRTGDTVQVTDGLAPGARVVAGGALFIDRAATQD
jgi:cobalt-zinc-cadmium efflux system membrane fusion protein